MFIGCDIGKNYFDISLNGMSLKFKNDQEGIEKFIEECKKHKSSMVVMEPTGGYEKRLLRMLTTAGLKVFLVHSTYIRNFAKSKKDLAKTDKIDAKVLAKYGEKMEPKEYEQKDGYRFELEELTHRRDSLVGIQTEEKLRLEKDPGSFVVKNIEKHLKYLSKEIESIDKKIKKLIIGKLLSW